MTREEEIKNESYKYGLSKYSDGISAMICASDFESGAKWADQHPRKGLWNSEKVIKWILENADKHTWYDETENECGITDNFTEDLQKAMEE